MATNIAELHNWPMPARHHWSRAQFERAIEAGLFEPGSALELIGGEITLKMSPQNSPHAAAIGAMQYALEDVFSDGYWVRVQLPLALTDDSEPEPDLAVVIGSWRDYTKSHPTGAALIVEISDTTLAIDRGAKASMYASAGAAEYWIVNLRDRVLEVHRQPSPMDDQPFGYHFLSVTRHTEAEGVASLSRPDAVILVADLLP